MKVLTVAGAPDVVKVWRVKWTLLEVQGEAGQSCDLVTGLRHNQFQIVGEQLGYEEI